MSRDMTKSQREGRDRAILRLSAEGLPKAEIAHRIRTSQKVVTNVIAADREARRSARGGVYTAYVSTAPMVSTTESLRVPVSLPAPPWEVSA